MWSGLGQICLEGLGERTIRRTYRPRNFGWRLLAQVEHPLYSLERGAERAQPASRFWRRLPVASLCTRMARRGDNTPSAPFPNNTIRRQIGCAYPEVAEQFCVRNFRVTNFAKSRPKFGELCQCAAKSGPILNTFAQNKLIWARFRSIVANVWPLEPNIGQPWPTSAAIGFADGRGRRHSMALV